MAADTPEMAALRALAAYLMARAGPGYTLDAVSVRYHGPDGISQRHVLMLRDLALPGQPRQEARHSPDFAAVDWFGDHYTFTDLQSRIIRQLWEAWERGTPEVRGSTLAAGAGAPNAEMRRIFEGHLAWGSVIVSPRKGLYRLAGAGEAPGPAA